MIPRSWSHALAPILLGALMLGCAETPVTREAPATPRVELDRGFVSLADSIEPLRARFNEAAGRPRFLTLLSPT